MPTYEYECESCAHRFEAVQKMMDAPLTQCPVCNKKIRRVLSGGIGISFQGTGFYVNDSKKTEKPAPEKKPSTNTPASGEKPPLPAASASGEKPSAPAAPAAASPAAPAHSEKAAS